MSGERAVLGPSPCHQPPPGAWVGWAEDTLPPFGRGCCLFAKWRGHVAGVLRFRANPIARTSWAYPGRLSQCCDVSSTCTVAPGPYELQSRRVVGKWLCRGFLSLPFDCGRRVALFPPQPQSERATGRTGRYTCGRIGGNPRCGRGGLARACHAEGILYTVQEFYE